jgi:hypothetical protein
VSGRNPGPAVKPAAGRALNPEPRNFSGRRHVIQTLARCIAKGGSEMRDNGPRNRRRGIIFVLVGAIAMGSALAVPSSAFADPPPNDDFPGTTITGLPFADTVDATNATDEPGEPFSPNQGKAVWYSFTPPADTVLVADTAGSEVIYSVAVYTGTSLADLINVADGSSEFAAVFRASGGVTYYFQIASGQFPPTAGAATFNLHQGAAPTNDSFPGIEITGLLFTDTVDTTFATVETGEPALFGATVWYNYTASKDITLVVDTLGSDYDTRISVETEISLDIPGGSIGDFTECGLARRVVFQVTTGETVWFQVGGKGFPGATGTLVFNLAEIPPGGAPEPDPLCAEPTPTPTSSVIDDFAGDGPAYLPGGGGPPPLRSGWPWAAVLAGGALSTLAAAALMTLLRRARSS